MIRMYKARASKETGKHMQKAMQALNEKVKLITTIMTCFVRSKIGRTKIL